MRGTTTFTQYAQRFSLATGHDVTGPPNRWNTSCPLGLGGCFGGIFGFWGVWSAVYTVTLLS